MKTKGIVTSEQIYKYERENGGVFKIMGIDRSIYNELSLKSMLISCFTYNGHISKDSDSYNKYIEPYLRTLGEKLFTEVYNEMALSFENVTIEHCTYTDSEGCTYNTLKYN